MNKIKSEDFKYIEECLGYIKDKDEVEENLQRIERSLVRIFGMPFNVTIAENEIQTPFIINVFPSNTDVDEICKLMCKSLNGRLSETEDDSDIIVRAWQDTKLWRVEIDPGILYDISKIYSPSEIAAAIVHDIIRVIYTPTVPVTVFRVLREEMTNVTHIVRALLKHDKIQMLLHLAILECCGGNIFSPIDEDKCCISDTLNNIICSLGYRDDYNALVDRLISNGCSYMVYKTQKDIENDIVTILVWVINIIKELEYNKKRLRDALEAEQARSESDVVKCKLKEIYSAFFEGVIDSYRTLLSEQWNDKPVDKYAGEVAFASIVKMCKATMETANEKVFDKKTGKLKKVSQLDIDVLVVDAGRIETHDDKIYLLDRIYDKLQIIETGIEYIDSGDTHRVVKQSKATLMDMKKQLEDLRRTVLATRILEKEYGVFIRYPKGYEG